MILSSIYDSMKEKVLDMNDVRRKLIDDVPQGFIGGTVVEGIGVGCRISSLKRNRPDRDVFIFLAGPGIAVLLRIADMNHEEPVVLGKLFNKRLGINFGAPG